MNVDIPIPESEYPEKIIKFTLRMPRYLYEKIHGIAVKQGISVQQWILDQEFMKP